ncbi:small nuclear RNA activating complex, polypeptide 3, 50kDa [Rhodotorula toruloides]|uniref:Small nuclear RNA activating complex, polypeptide 3, 50kDa n=1 Tax=Rhodotorula toruloides TaxID=5286 RepID=A0A511KCR2_RHOTO|nr:small nuclear RNA activating complex, polypeptide 3, 50kDa [Rhodotorula toruloides]
MYDELDTEFKEDVGPERTTASTLPSKNIRYYNEPLGPPSDVLDPAAFAKRVENALEQARSKLREIKQGWLEFGVEVEDILKDRCSVDDLRAENDELRDDSLIRPDLQHWIEDRWLPPNRPRPPRPHERRAQVVERAVEPGRDIEAQEGGEPEPEAFKLPGQAALDKAFEEAEHSGLNLLKRPDVSHYLRKTKMPDFNSLIQLRPSEIDVPPPARADPLAHLVYTITFHSIPRVVHKISYSVQRQTLVCLGSTTLSHIRANLMIGGDNIPVEKTGESDDKEEQEAEKESVEDEDEEQAEEQQEEIEVYDRPQQRLGGNFGGESGNEEAEERPTEWKNERRVTGAAFVAEGRIYADDAEGVSDYADILLKGIAATDKRTADELAAGPNELPHPHADPTAEAAAAIQAARRLPPLVARSGAELDYIRGAPLRQAKLGEMPLRLGQPYLFVHQGNSEHIWTVDDIRYVHPSDPSPFAPEGDAITSPPYRFVYPVTTHLSRQVGQSRCIVCDREAIELAVLNDELFGESPALVCRLCFETVHSPKRKAQEQVEKGKGKRRKVVVGNARVKDSDREFMEGVQVVPILIER